MLPKDASRAPALLGWVGSAAIVACLGHELWNRPTARQGGSLTVLSGTTGDPATADRALRFLAGVGGTLPPHAAVAFLWARRRTTRDDTLAFLLAIGQLPDQNVVTLDNAEYVAVFEGRLQDPHFREIRAVPDGYVYERNP